MRIFTIRSADPFTRISNTALRDARLSFKARGLLAYLLSHADGFNLSVHALRSVTTDGRDAINTAIHELEELGYLARVQVRGVAGRLGSTHYAVADDPALLNARDIADQIGGLLVAADAHERHAQRVALADNPPSSPKKRGQVADKPEAVRSPVTEKPEAVKNTPSSPKKRGQNADNPQDAPQKSASSPLTDYPLTGNPPLKEEQALEEQKKNIINAQASGMRSRAGDDVQPYGQNPNTGEKAPTARSAGFDELADTIRPDRAEEAPSGPAASHVPKRIASAGDKSLPDAKGRAPLAVKDRLDMSEFIGAWNNAIGQSAPWSATNTDLALHVLAHWTAAELREVFETMGRGRRGINSPLRYFCAALERLAAKAKRVAPRPAPAPLTGPPEPVKPRDALANMPAAQRAIVDAEVERLLRLKFPEEYPEE